MLSFGGFSLTVVIPANDQAVVDYTHIKRTHIGVYIQLDISYT